MTVAREATVQMQLFILGPAFGLPSIEAECAAAVALLQLYARDGYDLTAVADQQSTLPHLADGTAHVSGFNNILRHLVDKHMVNESSLLDDSQRTNASALTSFIENNAQTLLDISLYVGFENYRLATRPAFTKILPWYQNYIIPPKSRSAARLRTEHLGISSIDVDNVHQDMSNRPQGFDGVGREQPQFEAETQKRASLILPRKETVRSLLQRPEHAAIFRLNALADNFFEPLQEQLGSSQFVLDTPEPTSVDCLIYAYLALMLFPQLPQDWLASTMRGQYKPLLAYTQRVHELLQLSTIAEDVVRLDECKSQSEVIEHRKSCHMRLPWTVSPRVTAIDSFNEICIGIWNHVPVVGGSNRLELLHCKKQPFLHRHLPTILLSATLSIAAGTYVAVYTGLLVWPHGQALHIFGRRRLSDYGHVGAALAALNFLGSQARQA